MLDLQLLSLIIQPKHKSSTILPSLYRCSNCDRSFIGLKALGRIINQENKMDRLRHHYRADAKQRNELIPIMTIA